MPYTPEDLTEQVAGLRTPGSDQAATVVALVSAMAKSYTRGAGFDTDGNPVSDVAAVIVTASARLIAHPNQLARSETMGPFSVDYPDGGFQGWNLVERSVLDRYRLKAL